MIRRVFISLAVACLMLCNMSLLTSAAEQKPTYCAYCAAVLVSRGQHMGHWTTTHQVPTGLTVDGRPVMDTCTESHSVDRSELVCPNGCGRAWYEDKESVNHSSNYCPYK